MRIKIIPGRAVTRWFPEEPYEPKNEARRITTLSAKNSQIANEPSSLPFGFTRLTRTALCPHFGHRFGSSISILRLNYTFETQKLHASHFRRSSHTHSKLTWVLLQAYYATIFMRCFLFLSGHKAGQRLIARQKAQARPNGPEGPNKMFSRRCSIEITKRSQLSFMSFSWWTAIL